MSESFNNKFKVNPNKEDLESIIADLSSPSISLWQQSRDMILEKIPVKWAVLLIGITLGSSFFKVLGSDLKPEDVEPIRIPLLIVGIVFS